MQYWVHHLNDMSGSPLILRQKLSLVSDQTDITLITNQGQGFLSEWKGRKIIVPYHKSKSMVFRYFSLSLWYVRVICILLLRLRSNDSLVISTLVGSPLLLVPRLRKIKESKILINEIIFRVPIWTSIGLIFARSQNVAKVYLSNFVRDYWNFPGSYTIVPPQLRHSLVKMANDSPPKKEIRLNALSFFLVGSYIPAKGYRLFIDIAREFQNRGAQHQFFLYLSGDLEKFNSEYPTTSLPENLHVTFNSSDPEIFANKDIFLGLTDPNLWVETFGQTFAEAMLFGNIAFVPSVGGHLEYAVDQYNSIFVYDYELQAVLRQIDDAVLGCDLELMRSNARNSIVQYYQRQG